MMKALTLWQPWATLVALGAKRYETRAWRTHHRGPLAIHAAQGFSRHAFEMLLVDEPAVRRALFRGGFDKFEDLPRGAVVAIAQVVDCLPTSEVLAKRLSKREQTFGDYSPGRWAWLLEDVEMLAEPVPARGTQRLWNWLR